MSKLGVKSLKEGERGSTVLGARGVCRAEAETFEGRRTDNLQMSFDICVRRTRCEQDYFDSERHTVSFNPSSIPHLSRPSYQEKKK